MVVYAAGAVLWRIENNELLVALVHRGRYDDWAWAKGKVDPGETLPQTAVREIKEETGLKVKLGVPLGIQRYRLPNQNLKEVHYWAAKVTDKALAESEFKANDEISQVSWFTPSQAKKKLSYSHDQEQLDALIELHESNRLDTFPVILLRHGKARSRATWNGQESSRPLLTEGNLQAEAIPPILKAYGAKLVYSSPWTRCLSTVAPYAQKRNVKVKTVAAFTEHANESNPGETQTELSVIMSMQKPVVVCTHRPVLPTMIDEIMKRSDSRLGAKLHLAALLKPGSMAIIHLTKVPEGGLAEVVDVEFASPLIEKKK